MYVMFVRRLYIFAQSFLSNIYYSNEPVRICVPGGTDLLFGRCTIWCCCSADTNPYFKRTPLITFELHYI